MAKFKLSEEEKALFNEAVKGVKPLKKTDKVNLQPPPKKIKRPKTAIIPEKIVDELSDQLRETVTGEQNLFFAQPNLPPKLLRDLRQGRIKQSAILDLHGLTVVQARQTIVKFLQACIKQHIRCVRIIHGKGRLQSHDQPVLKNQVNNWLQQHHAVLAFCSAQPVDGGKGAVYVLLRQKLD